VIICKSTTRTNPAASSSLGLGQLKPSLWLLYPPFGAVIAA
jgi:hypothetical protein